jgi:hypothetical protein
MLMTMRTAPPIRTAQAQLAAALSAGHCTAMQALAAIHTARLANPTDALADALHETVQTWHDAYAARMREGGTSC